MHDLFSNIKAVGFDLDKTLYAETAAMKRVATRRVLETILELKPELSTIENADKVYGERYRQIGSWSKILKEYLEIQNPAPILLRCFETAAILNLIQKDEPLARIMEFLREKYSLFLITGSSRRLALAKLQKIGIDPEIFQFSFFGDDENFITKLEPDNFRYFLSQSQLEPREHAYVGDGPQTDIIIPKSLGMKTVYVGRELVPEADASVSDIHDIAELFL